MSDLPTVTQSFPPVPLGELIEGIRAFPAMAGDAKKAWIGQLVAAHAILNLRWGPGWRYRRARRIALPPASVDDLTWNKRALVVAGRTNPEGFGVLYLSDRVETALRETRVEDDRVVLAEFTINPEHNVAVVPVGELTKIHRTGRGFLSGDVSEEIDRFLNACALEEARSLLITDSFLLNCLTNKDDDYALTSAVATGIIAKHPQISVIAYPSVRQYGGLNFAVRTEDFWNDWSLSSVRHGHARHLAEGHYRLSGIRHVTGVTSGAQLQWGDANDDREGLRLELSPPWTDRRPA